MNETKPQPNFKIIQIIYGSLILGVLVAFNFMSDFSTISFDFSFKDDAFIYILPIVFIAVIFLSNFLFKKTINGITETDSLFTKITKYQTANIMRGAPLEAFAFFAIFTNTSFVVVAILIMLYYFPSKNKFENTVALSIEDKARLREM